MGRPLGYAVIGTPNLLEYDQGFFVKGGDGLADVKPIARLYKTQVYALARHLGLPDGDRRAPARRPRPSACPQTQEEFYFGHPYDRMDVLLVAASRAASAGRGPGAARGHRRRRASRAAYDEIARKRTATAYLHAAPAS